MRVQTSTNRHSKVTKGAKPYSKNPVYQMPIRVKCNSCTMKKRTYKNLWTLFMHYKLEHQESFENSQIKKVAELIVEGVLV